MNFLASGRHLPERRDVEVAEEGERHGPRNGRRRHHEVVRTLSGAPQLRPLADAEFVLFVDDHEAQIGELHVVLHHSMGPQDDVDLSLGQPVEDLLAIGRLQSAREQRPPHTAGLQDGPQRPGMLLGEDLRRRHERRLVAVRDAQQHRVDRGDGLSAPDVPLHEAVHRPFPGHVVSNLFDDPSLAARQLEREEPHDPSVDFGGCR